MEHSHGLFLFVFFQSRCAFFFFFFFVQVRLGGETAKACHNQCSLKRRLKKNTFGNQKKEEQCITSAVTGHIPVICKKKKKKKAKQLQQTVTKEREKSALK